MGLDASVMCRCWQDGKVDPDRFAGHLRLDAEGYLELDVPWEANEALHNDFWAWMATACPHYRMELADERLANWSGYRHFQEGLAHAGWEHLPTLRQYLPEANGGLLPAAASADALRELAWFEQTWKGFEVACLIDTDTGTILFEEVGSYEGVFILSGRENVDVGVDRRGLFVRSRLGDRMELFRSMRCEQLRAGEETRLVDRSTGQVCNLGGLVITPGGVPPARLHVANGRKTAGDFAYIIEPLKRLLAASIQSGNPIRWE